MNNDLSKCCADFLRSSCDHHPIKASHAREIVAAFFGYKSHAALKFEKNFPLSVLEESSIFIPDLPLVELRRKKLKELPESVPISNDIVSMLVRFLKEEGFFAGSVWQYETIEAYVVEVLLIENDSRIMDELSGLMAGTNTEYDEFPYYEEAIIFDLRETLKITVSGNLQGTPIDDKPYCGNNIDMEVDVFLYRNAGKRGFLGFDIEAKGVVSDF